MFYADPVRHTLLDDILRELLQKNAIRKAPPNTCALFSRVSSSKEKWQYATSHRPVDAERIAGLPHLQDESRPGGERRPRA